MTMVEQVARALAEEEGYAYDPLPYDRRARAAIRAMRDPTPEILKAMWRRNDDNDAEEATLENWREAIDAALGQGALK